MAYEIVIGRSQSDKKKLGLKASIFIGRHYVKMGQTTSLSSDIYLDVNKSHIFFIAGKRGSGKCLHGDTLITLEDGSQIPIRDLEKDERRVFSLNDKLKMEKSKKSDFFSREVDSLLKIKLRSGKEIKLTPEHPLLTIKGWKDAQELKIGSRIASPRKLPAFGSRNMPEHEVKLLSYLIAEGHTKSIVLFANSDEKIVEDFRLALSEFDPLLELIKEKENHYRISSPKWKNKVLNHDKGRDEKGHFLKGAKNICEKRSIRKLIERENVFGLLATKKYFSQNIMQLNKERMILFLNRLFSCDGSIYKINEYWEISYASSSEKLIRRVQNILLRFGIASKLRDKKIKLNEKIFQSYELVINAPNTLKFVKEIGFFGEKEEKQIIALEDIQQKTRNPNIDTIPKEIWEYFKPRNWAEVGRHLGYKHPKAMRERIRYSPSRQMLLQIAKVEQNSAIQLLANSDIFWDEIISMEMMEGKFKVYDICVPENHNFVANDIIVHNSYTMGAIAEGMATLPKDVSANIAVVIFDTMGIYWTMKYPNHKDEALLRKWGLEGKGLDVSIYTPTGYFDEYKEKGIPTDFPFSLQPSELAPSDWAKVFEINPLKPEGVLLERIIHTLKEGKDNYSLNDLIQEAGKDERADKHIKELVENLFMKAKSWGLFSTKGTKIKDLVQGGQVTIIDVSCYATVPGSWGIKATVIGIISQKLFIERMIAKKNEEYEAVHKAERFFAEEEAGKKKMPLVWLMLDEAHEFLPREGETAASDSLITILREGRQPGISLVLVTQQPGKIHTDVMTQADTVIAHRLTAKIDVEALGTLMQSYMRKGLDAELNVLPGVKGAAVIFDDLNEKIYPMQVRPRFTWHGGEAPSALRVKKDRFEL